MAILHPDAGERVAGLQFTGPGNLPRPSLAWEQDSDTGITHRGVQGEFSFISNAVEVARVTADGLLLALFTPGSVLFAGAGGVIAEDTGLTYASGTDLLTVVGGLVTPAVGPVSTQQHTLPAVTSDTVALLAATQIFTAKTLTSPIVGTQITLDQTTADYTFTWANPAAARAISIVDPGGTDAFLWRDATQTVTNKTVNLTSNTLVATSLQLLTALTDETGTGLLVFNASPSFTGVIANAVGTASLPSYTFTGDLNTGLSAATADNLVLSAGGITVLTALPSTLVINEDGEDLDVRLESDLTAAHFISNAGTFGGRGSFAFGGDNQPTTSYILISPPSMTVTANAAFQQVDISNYGTMTIPTGVCPLAVSLNIEPMGFTLTGSITTAASLRIGGAPTGATNNYALWVDAGASRFDGNMGFFSTAPAAQQTSGANLTNNVTSGGTTDQIDDFTSLTVYATDAAAIRNDIYQLARKVKQINDGLRLYGLFT